MTYDSVERVLTQTDANGHTTTFTYGPNGGLAAGQTEIADQSGTTGGHLHQRAAHRPDQGFRHAERRHLDLHLRPGQPRRVHPRPTRTATCGRTATTTTTT